MMVFYSETKKIKYFLDPPPPKKRRMDTNGRKHGYTHIIMFVQPAACDLDFY